jgi:hypothetical protein
LVDTEVGLVKPWFKKTWSNFAFYFEKYFNDRHYEKKTGIGLFICYQQEKY